MTGALENKIALITGAAQGIGLAIAEKLASLGADIVVADIQEDKARATAESLVASYGHRAIPVRVNVTEMASVEAMVQAAMDAFGRIDILINNAGITRDTLLMRMTEADWDAVLDINLKGAFLCTKAVHRIMMRQRYGRIVNIGSVVGLGGNPGQANYASSKAGLVGLTKTVAKELGSRNITVNLVAPGFIETAMTAKLSPEVIAEATARIALQRMGKPEDVAKAVAFLVSEEADYITSQVLRVDGGMII